MRKKIFYSGLFFILFICLINGQIKIEAENGKLYQLNTEKSEDASGGKFIKIEKTGSVEWEISLKSDGYYKIAFCYKSPNGERVQQFYYNGKKSEIGFGYSPEWKIQNSFFRLKKGRNTIKLEKQWGDIALDYFTVEKTELIPELKPLNCVFTGETNEILKFNLRVYDDRLDGISIGKHKVNYKIEKYPYLDDTYTVYINGKEIKSLSAGKYNIDFRFGKKQLSSVLNIPDENKNDRLTILFPDVEHGAAVLFILPDKQTLLIDSGKKGIRDTVLIPMFGKLGVNKINNFIITHYHDDHDSEDKGELIKQQFKVDNFFDYNNLKSGQEINIAGLKVKVLNSLEDGKDENTSSLSMKIEYNGFVYIHGGDTYAENQQMILKRFPNDIKGDLFFANHHFHGSLENKYIKEMEPKIIILQAQEAIYARSTYMINLKQDIEKYFKDNNSAYIETLPVLETGPVMIKIKSKNDWYYKTFINNNTTTL